MKSVKVLDLAGHLCKISDGSDSVRGWDFQTKMYNLDSEDGTNRVG